MNPYEPIPEERQMLMAQVLRGREAMAANSQRANQLNTLSAVTQMANNPAAAAAATSADKGLQTRYGTTKLGQHGVMLDATGESVPSQMYFEDKLDARAQNRGLLADRLTSAKALADSKLADAAKAREERRSLALTLAAMNIAGRQTLKETPKPGTGEGGAGKQLGFPAIEKLSKKESVRDAFAELTAGFKKEFSGTPVVAGLENTMGRYAPGLSGKGDQANWWQNYDEQANMVRNALFGSALTATEQKAFDAQTIKPGMDPDEITRRLAQQSRAAAKAYSKLVRSTQASGFDVSGFDAGEIPDAPIPGGKNPTSEPPAGISAEDWKHLTPEERKLWAK